MASLVLADDVFIEEFENFDNWESHPHFEIIEGEAFTDRHAVLVSNNFSLDYDNCTLYLETKAGENDTRIGLYNISLDEYEWIYSPEYNTSFEYYFDNEDLITEYSSIKIQTQFQEGEFYIDNINLSCHISTVESEPSSSPQVRGGGFYTSSLPSVNFQSATGGQVAATFSMLPYESQAEFASLIPMSFFSQYCDENRYNFCAYTTEETPDFVAKADNIIIYGLIIGGMYFYLKKKR